MHFIHNSLIEGCLHEFIYCIYHLDYILSHCVTSILIILSLLMTHILQFLSYIIHHIMFLFVFM